MGSDVRLHEITCLLVSDLVLQGLYSVGLLFVEVPKICKKELLEKGELKLGTKDTRNTIEKYHEVMGKVENSHFYAASQN